MAALLRGVNVGGRTKLAMSDLRAAAESCGFEQVRTYIQSGNVVFAAPGRTSAKTAAAKLAAAVATPDLRPEVVVRTRDELARVVSGNPFLRRGEDSAHLHVVFTTGSAKSAVGDLDLDRYAPDEAAAVGHHLYLFLPNGMGRSRLAADLARTQGPTGTTRSWRTVLKLQELLDEIE